jgi:hypothetical protein
MALVNAAPGPVPDPEASPKSDPFLFGGFGGHGLGIGLGFGGGLEGGWALWGYPYYGYGWSRRGYESGWGWGR